MRQAHFVDTSALVKRYVDEPGSAALAERSFGTADVEVFVSALTYAEMYATFGRLKRDGSLTVADHDAALGAFERDWTTLVIVELGPSVRAQVPALARAQSLRGADLVQLASAAHLASHRALDLFVVSDVRLANAAAAARLPVFNPEL